MIKFLLPLLMLLSTCDPSFATQITNYTWSVKDTVTNTKLNNQQNAVSSVVNGNIDNTNIGTGYSLLKTVAVLPSAGTQGTVAFLTSDNSLNLDNGSSWIKTITLASSTTGVIPYYNAGWQSLTPGTADYSLISNGASSLPSYRQLPLATGVSGTLPATNGGTGVIAYSKGDVLYASATNTLSALPAGTSGQFLKTQGAGANPIWADSGAYAAGTVLLASANTARNKKGATYTKVKEIQIPRAGTLTIKFDLQGDVGTNALGTIYRNGVAVGTERTQPDNSGYATFSENISGWSAGDLCQLYYKGNNATADVYAKNFQLYAATPTIETVNTD